MIFNKLMVYFSLLGICACSTTGTTLLFNSMSIQEQIQKYGKFSRLHAGIIDNYDIENIAYVFEKEHIMDTELSAIERNNKIAQVKELYTHKNLFLGLKLTSPIQFSKEEIGITIAIKDQNNNIVNGSNIFVSLVQTMTTTQSYSTTSLKSIGKLYDYYFLFSPEHQPIPIKDTIGWTITVTYPDQKQQIYRVCVLAAGKCI